MYIYIKNSAILTSHVETGRDTTILTRYGQMVRYTTVLTRLIQTVRHATVPGPTRRLVDAAQPPFRRRRGEGVDDRDTRHVRHVHAGYDKDRQGDGTRGDEETRRCDTNHLRLRDDVA